MLPFPVFFIHFLLCFVVREMPPRLSNSCLVRRGCEGSVLCWNLREIAVSKAPGNLAGKGWEECESWRKLCAVPACQVVFQLGLLPVNSPSSRVRRGRRPLHTARCVQSCFKLHKAWGEVCAYVCVGESMCIYKRTCACVCTRMWRPEDNPRYWFFFFSFRSHP